MDETYYDKRVLKRIDDLFTKMVGVFYSFTTEKSIAIESAAVNTVF